MQKRTIKQTLKDLFFNKIIYEKTESYTIKNIPNNIIELLKQPLD